MPSEAAAILKHGRIYAVANVVSRASGLLLLPLYAKVLTASEFGVYGLVTVVADMVAVMLMIAVNNAFTVAYFEQAEDEGRRRVVSTGFLALGALTSGLLMLAYPAGWALSVGLFGDAAQAGVLTAALGSVAAGSIFELALTYYRALKHSGTCLLISAGKAVLLLGLNLLFLLGLELGVAGIFLANGVALAGLGLLLAAAVLADSGLAFSPAILRRMVALGLPFVPQSLLDIMNQFVARYLLNVLVTTAAVGVFSFGMRLAATLYLLLTASFLQIWSVHRIESQRQPVDHEQSEFVFHLFLIVLTTAALGMALTGPEILWLIAPDDYAPVLPCLPFLVAAFVLHGARMHPEVALMKAQRVGALPWISAASLVVGSVLAAGLIWGWGVYGASIAVLGREVFQTALTEAAARRLCPGETPLRAARLLGILAPAAVACVVGWLSFGAAVDPALVAGKLALVTIALAAAVFGPGLGADGRALLFRLAGGASSRVRAAR